MNIDIVMQNATASRKWLESREGESVMAFLHMWHAQVLRAMQTESDPAELYRAQGRYQVLSRFLGLVDEVREYQNKQHRGAVGKVS